MSEGSGGWGGRPDADQRLAQDPGTAGADLARIAAERPDLRAALAANPATYPALVEWLRALHDPAVDAALEARAGAPVAAPPTPVAPAPAAPVYATPAPAGWSPDATPAPAGWSPDATPAPAGWSPDAAAPAGAWGSGAAAPAAPAASWQGYGQPGTDGTVPVLLESPRRRRGRGWIVAGVAAALVLGLGGAGYAFVGAKLAGSPTPEAAVTKLLTGVAKKDALALAGSLSPAEFSPFKAAYGDVTDRQAIQDPAVRAAVQKALDSLKITVDGLKTQSTTIDEGLAKVTILAGTVRVDGDPRVIADGLATAIESSQAGKGLLAGNDTGDIRTQLTDQLSAHLPYTLNLADDLAFKGGGPFLVTVQEKGKWFVSPLMTLGQYLAESQGVRPGPMPSTKDVVKPKDPVDAAQQFAQALEKVPDGDLGPLASVLPLAERRFITVYGQAFVDAAKSEDPASGGSLRMTSTDFSVVQQNGDSAQVAPTKLAFDVGDSTGSTTSVSTDGRCLTVASEGSDSVDACTSDLPLLASLGLDQLRLTTVKEDGGWYVSVFGTVGTWSTTVEKHLTQLSKDGKLDDQAWWTSQLPAGTACGLFGTCS